jgi:acetoin utilization deacetylase AcuC-like enzyme
MKLIVETSQPVNQINVKTNNKSFERQQKIIDSLSDSEALELYQLELNIVRDDYFTKKYTNDSSVHDSRMINFLMNAYESYESDKYDDHHSFVNDNGDQALIPAVCSRSFNCDILNKIPLWKHVGYYCNETTTPLFKNTWSSIKDSINSTISATHRMLNQQLEDQVKKYFTKDKIPSTIYYALTSNPGHHAGHSYYSGYCYLNNAAFAAYIIYQRTGKKVGILDLDIHAGDGTYDIFTRTPIMRTIAHPISLNISPEFDYPHYVGFDSDGDNNFLTFGPRITTNEYIKLIVRAFDIIRAQQCEYLIVAFGCDTYANDPEVLNRSRTQIKVEDYLEIGQSVGSLSREAGLNYLMVVQEGGYDMNYVGPIVRNFLYGILKGKSQAT